MCIFKFFFYELYTILDVMCTSNDIYQRRTNTAMPANTAIPMFLTSCETEMHIWNIAESELLCVRVATLLINKYANILRVMS